MARRDSRVGWWALLAGAVVAVGGSVYLLSKPAAAAPSPSPNPKGGGPTPFPIKLPPGGIHIPPPPPQLHPTIDINTQDPSIPVAMHVGDRLHTDIIGWTLVSVSPPGVITPSPISTDASLYVASTTGTTILHYNDADGNPYPPFTVSVT